MIAPTRLVYETAGRPDLIPKAVAMLSDTPATCSVCNRWEERTADADKALGKNFTDRALFRGPLGRVCPACLWCASGKGTETLRAWTVVCTPGRGQPGHAVKAHAWLGDTPGLCLTTRGNPRPVIETLTRPPDGEWVVSVAQSGQKHVLPYAHTNHGSGGWAVRLETVTVTSTPAEFEHILSTVAALRIAGHRQDDITMGRPTLSAIKDMEGADTWRALSHDLRTYTRSPVLDLAAWCLTKETLNDYA